MVPMAFLSYVLSFIEALMLVGLFVALWRVYRVRHTRLQYERLRQAASVVLEAYADFNLIKDPTTDETMSLAHGLNDAMSCLWSVFRVDGVEIGWEVVDVDTP